MKLSNYENFSSVEILTDGYGVTWGTILSIPSEKLFEIGTTIDPSLDDFKSFAANRELHITKIIATTCG